jgi:hypothetical protein
MRATQFAFKEKMGCPDKPGNDEERERTWFSVSTLVGQTAWSPIYKLDPEPTP